MVLFAIAVFAVLILSIGATEAREINWAWGEAARDLDADYRRVWVYGAPRIDGAGLSIRSSRGKNGFTRFEVDTGPANLSLGRGNDWAFGRERVRTGDPSFDEAVSVGGDPEDVVALMDDQTRSAVRGFVGNGGELRDGKLRFRLQAVCKDPRLIARIARQMEDLGELLSRQSRKKLLLNTSMNDPIPAVRVRALSMLGDHFPKTPELLSAVDSAFDDPDASVRVLAASLDRGERAQRALRGVVADARLQAEPRLAAFNWLLSLFGYPADLAAALLQSPDWTLQRAAVVAVRNARDLPQLDRICALTREEPPDLAQAAAAALGVLGDVRAEPHLIALLRHREEKVQMAAAVALGALGTVRAVEPLLPLTRGLLHGDLHAAARDAVRRIQSRLGDADEGRLSVAPAGPEGALSVAGEGGELSVAPAGTRIKP